MKSLVFFAAALCCSCGPGIGPVVPKTPVQRQMIGLLEKFDRWDDNGDGQLSQKELDHGIRSLQGKPQEVDYKSQDVMDFYDTNKNGRISLSEAQEGYNRAHEVGKTTGS